MSAREPESFVIRRKPIALPPDATRDDLLARRSQLVEAVLASPPEHRDRVRRSVVSRREGSALLDRRRGDRGHDLRDLFDRRDPLNTADNVPHPPPHRRAHRRRGQVHSIVVDPCEPARARGARAAAVHAPLGRLVAARAAVGRLHGRAEQAVEERGKQRGGRRRQRDARGLRRDARGALRRLERRRPANTKRRPSRGARIPRPARR